MSHGLYLHLPFCRQHCSYCAFAISTDLELQDRYLEALQREIGATPAGTVVETIYFGGGTPSRTSPSALRRLAGQLHQRFHIHSDAEFSLEANPEDVDERAIEAWRDLGVNRLSIGVQSFQEEELQPLGRLHGSRQARAAVELAVRSGMDTSLDLILGLPLQTSSSFRETLQTALQLGAGHISVYMLDLEERTPLHTQWSRGRIHIPDDETIAGSYQEAIELLQRGGLRQYEISNFARPGKECRHNLRYWRRDPYFGFGLGAHSFLQGTRRANTRDIRRYIAASPDAADFSETLSELDERREQIFLRLRQTAGIERVELHRLCGMEGIEWSERGLREGWLRASEERVAFTATGFLLSNALISDLF